MENIFIALYSTLISFFGFTLVKVQNDLETENILSKQEVSPLTQHNIQHERQSTDSFVTACLSELITARRKPKINLGRRKEDLPKIN